jgi:hypothetical protein
VIDCGAVATTVIRLSLAALVCAAALIAVAGCGGNGDGSKVDLRDPNDVAQGYVDARNRSDSDTLCELYSDQLKHQLGATGDCAAFLAEQTAGAKTSFRLVRVDESGGKATATIQAAVADGQGTASLGIQLERQDNGDWLITSLSQPGAGD